MRPSTIPRRDWILLPLIGLLTVAALIGLASLLSHRLFQPSPTKLSTCMVLNDPSTGIRAVPDSVCRYKLPEGELTEFKFNACGDRTSLDCHAKPPGAFRIVIAGSSTAMGLGVPENETFAARMQSELSQRAGRPIEIYNAAMGGGAGTLRSVDLRFDHVLDAKPDLILWVLTPWDIEYVSELFTEPAPDPHRPATPAPFLGLTATRVRETLKAKSALGAGPELSTILRDFVTGGRIGFLLSHFLYQDRALYLNANRSVEYLKANPSPSWRAQLRQAETYAADIESRAKAAGVPMVAVLIPSRIQAAMISDGRWDASYDPLALDRELRSIIELHGERYLEISPDFLCVPDAQQYYLPVDTHLTPAGNALITSILMRKLTGGSVPELTDRDAYRRQAILGR